jgi:hypothetical protein
MPRYACVRLLRDAAETLISECCENAAAEMLAEIAERRRYIVPVCRVHNELNGM